MILMLDVENQSLKRKYKSWISNWVGGSSLKEGAFSFGSKLQDFYARALMASQS